MNIFFPLSAFPNTLYIKNGINTPTQVKANKERIHMWSKRKMSPNTPRATMQILDANPSIPSIRLIALVIKTTSNMVSGIPNQGERP